MAKTNSMNVDLVSPLSPEGGVAVVELADDLQIRKQTVFKVMKRLGFQAVKRRESDRRGQLISVISRAEADAVRDELRRTSSGNKDDSDFIGDTRYFSEDCGVFYIVQLEPTHDPGRFKVGFTTDVDGRLRRHRSSAPFAQCVRIWPCRRTWEHAAIDCVTIGAEQLHTEVYRADSIQVIIDRADKFFSVMPVVSEVADVEGKDIAVDDAV